MSGWVPTTDFEEEIVSLQPEHNFIFGSCYLDDEPEPSYPRPQNHLELAENRRKTKRKYPPRAPATQKLNAIAAVQRIACTKPLGEQPTIDDWNTDEHVEREIVAMIRHCGLGPSVDLPLSEEMTIPAYPITEDVHVMRNGSRTMPVFFHEKFFKFDMNFPASYYEDKEQNDNGTESANTSGANGYHTPVSPYSTTNSSASFCSALTHDGDESRIPLLMTSDSTENIICDNDQFPMFDVDYVPLDDTSSESSASTKSSSKNPFLQPESHSKGSNSAKKLQKKSKSNRPQNVISTTVFGLSSFSHKSQSKSLTEPKVSPVLLKNSPKGSNRQSTNPISTNLLNGNQTPSNNVTSSKPKRYYTPKELYELRRKMKK